MKKLTTYLMEEKPNCDIHNGAIENNA